MITSTSEHEERVCCIGECTVRRDTAQCQISRVRFWVRRMRGESGLGAVCACYTCHRRPGTPLTEHRSVRVCFVAVLPPPVHSDSFNSAFLPSPARVEQRSRKQRGIRSANHIVFAAERKNSFSSHAANMTIYSLYIFDRYDLSSRHPFPRDVRLIPIDSKGTAHACTTRTGTAQSAQRRR